MTQPDYNMTREEVLHEVETGWNELQAFLAPLTAAQLTGPTDAAGWTARDHLIHLVAWEEAALRLLDGVARHETLGVGAAAWTQGEDAINALVHQRDRDLSLEAVMEKLAQTHARLMARLEGMTQEELQLPHRHYQPESTDERPILRWVIIGTTDHYREHIPWMAEIVGVE